MPPARYYVACAVFCTGKLQVVVACMGGAEGRSTSGGRETEKREEG